MIKISYDTLFLWEAVPKPVVPARQNAFHTSTAIRQAGGNDRMGWFWDSLWERGF